MLQGKTILISGAGSDLGAAVALAYADSGADLILLDKKQRTMTPVYDQIYQSTSNQPLMVEFDILKSDTIQFDLLANSLSEQYASLHGLTHCAMWGAPLTPIIHASMATWQSVLEQQLTRPMYLTKSLLPLINRSGCGRILFPVMSSGRVGRAYWGAVGCGFAGVENLCEIINQENETSNTRAFTLACDTVRTAVRKKYYPADTEQHLLQPEDNAVTDRFIEIIGSQNPIDPVQNSIS